MAENPNLQVLVKNGEITGKPIYQVRGQAHWHSTPAIAKQVYAREQAFLARGGWKGNREDTTSKKR